MKISLTEHKLLALWAADCAEHVLHVFESTSVDDRPRKAIDAIRAWVLGEMKMTEVRKTAFEARAAARVTNGETSVMAARAAGHAAATAHVPDHVNHAAAYALKAAKDPIAENEWQQQKLLEIKSHWNDILLESQRVKY